VRLWKGKRVLTPLGPATVVNPVWGGPQRDQHGHRAEVAVAVQLDRGGHRLYPVRDLDELKASDE